MTRDENPFFEFLKKFNNEYSHLVHTNRPENKLEAVIVESRNHPLLTSVIRNVMYFLGDEWNLHVYHGCENAKLLERGLPDWNFRKTQLNFPNGSLSSQIYSRLLMSESFWKNSSADSILIFQVDTLLCRHGINEFLGYDYVGAPCGTEGTLNGGLSLRKRSVMLELIHRRPDLFENPTQEPEDTIFCRALRLENKNLPSNRDASRFAVEASFWKTPIGIHGTDKNYLNSQQAQEIVDNIHLDQKTAA